MPLIGVFIFSQREKPLPNKPASRPITTARASNLEADKVVERYSETKKSGVMTEDAKRQVDEMREKTNSLGRKAALLMTEEVQHGMVNKAMQRLEQVYQPLFNKWNLSNADRQAILDIIRDREARLTSIRTNAQKEGINEVMKSIRVIEAERAVYIQEISLLLGPEKTREFAEVDSQDYNRFRVKLPARD